MRSFFYGISASVLGGVLVGMSLTPALADLTRFDETPTAHQPALIVAQADVAPSSSAPWVVGTDYLKPPQPIIYAPVVQIADEAPIPDPDWSVPERPHVDYLAQAPAYPSQTGDVVAAPANALAIDNTDGAAAPA